MLCFVVYLASPSKKKYRKHANLLVLINEITRLRLTNAFSNEQRAMHLALQERRVAASMNKMELTRPEILRLGRSPGWEMPRFE